ncbi:ABC transporter ATP-binding protein [Ilyobacter polytropus]|uniref:ABC transporter related protein n=1 Tax=Ilyobacter polytropus (strain ATCC 51220 / DSM 2926 / LMG 16218 / CuHBu1) TaxID=572544 RepID=E3HCC0_ILYPC|nr:ABC transporter ATP-binding protein [Ilyobacter polytropus]ADO84380.1 ABC transporter related protein [Ilyobacter polytropus DSM 2926]
MKDLLCFARYYKPHFKLVILDFICAFAMAGLDLLFPLLVQRTLDDVIPRGDLKLLYIFGAVLVALYILRYLASYVVYYWGKMLGILIEYDMRRDLFAHVQKLSFTFFDNTKTGAIMSRIVNDLSYISEFAHIGPEDFFLAILKFTGTFIIMFTMNKKLTLIIFSLVPLLIWFAAAKKNLMKKSFGKSRKKISAINSQVEDSISGIRVVQAFTNEKFENEKFQKKNTEFREAKRENFKLSAEYFSGLSFIMNIIQLTTLFFGGIFILKGEITAGIVIGFLLYVSKFMEPIRRMMLLMQSFQKGMAGFVRFRELMDKDPDIKDKPNAVALKKPMGTIQFENVSFKYASSEQDILKDFSMSIKSGEKVALVGSSGAGKTTICNLIPRFYEVERGAIKIDDRDIKNYTLESLRDNIGIIQQDVFLFSGSIEENILYGNLTASREDVIEAAKKARIYEFILSLADGFDTNVGERGVKLSGGQKQRIAIARIFLKNPKILILDEATSALDNNTERLIQESIDELTTDRTTITIAHRLSTIENADRIIVLNSEGIVEEGTHNDLVEKKGEYFSLVEKHIQETA